MAGGEETLKCDVRKLPKSAVALDFSLPAKVSNEIHLKVVADLAKNAKVPGFRDGKVPPQAIIAKIGMAKVKEATVEQIVEVGLQQSGVTSKLHTIGVARLPDGLGAVARRFVAGKAFEFTLEVDVYPEVPLDEAMYKMLAVKVENVEFNQEAYDSALQKLRGEHATPIEVEPGTPAKLGNRLLVNMEGFLANEDGTPGDPLPNVAGGDGVEVPLDVGKFMPGLVEGLVGAKAGETKQISVMFPPRTSAPQLAGKMALFNVAVLKVQYLQLPEEGDEFAAKVVSGMTWPELDAKLREGVEQDQELRLKANTHRELQKALVRTLPTEFEVPNTLVDQVTKERFASMLAEMREQGTSDAKLKEVVSQENYDRYSKISMPMTLSQIKADLALRAVGQQQALSVPQSEVDDEVLVLQAQAMQRGERFKESEARPKVEAQLEKTMVLDWLEASATVTLIESKEESPEDLLGISPEDLAAALSESAPASEINK